LPSEQRVTVYQHTKKTQNVRLDYSLSRCDFYLGFKEMQISTQRLLDRKKWEEAEMNGSKSETQHKLIDDDHKNSNVPYSSNGDIILLHLGKTRIWSELKWCMEFFRASGIYF
jgi:hypothetical protein